LDIIKVWKAVNYMTDTSMKRIYTVDEIRRVVADIANEYGVSKVTLFGSYARGDADNNSDIDLRIDKGRLRGLFQLSGFRIDLEERLGTPVDVLTTESLDEEFLNRIQSEEVMLFERC